MSELDLKTVIDRVDALARQRMAEDGTPGLVLALTDRDGLLHAVAHGFANAESREPMTTSHLLETGSIGKSFTAIAILQLHEEGRIDLRAPIHEYLPWFEVQSAWEPPAIHHALSHTTGLIYGTDFSPDPRYEVWALRDTAAGSPPGTYYHYSNVVYKALGLILERLEGKPYAAIIRERVLDPLGMTETAATITHETRRRMAQPYRRYYDDRPSHASHGLVRLGADARLTTGACEVSQSWSHAFWDHPSAPDGLLYRSRHDPSRMSAAIYDRAADAIAAVRLGDFGDPGMRNRLQRIISEYGFVLVED